MGIYIVLILFAFLVEGVFGDEVKSVIEGDSVSLNTSVTKEPNDTMLWYFEDILIAQINGHPSTSCLYDGKDRRFRDRLKVDYETGSLNITNITTEHAGRYEAKLDKADSSGKTEKLNRKPDCDSTRIITNSRNLGETKKSISLTVSASKADKGSGLSPAVPGSGPSSAVPGSGLSSGGVAGIVVCVLLVAAAVVGVIYCRGRSCINDIKKLKQVEQVSNDETQNEKII